MSLEESLIMYLSRQGVSDKYISDFRLELANLSIEDKSDLLYGISSHLYKEKPVDIKTFIHDPYFLGKIYSSTIYPIWDNLLSAVYPTPLLTQFSEVIESTATRCGKSVSASISMMYEMHRLMCMYNPAEVMIGVSTGGLLFALLSIDERQATGGVGRHVETGLTNSPYFIENVNKKLPLSKITSGVEVTDNIILVAGSSRNVVMGKELYACVYDEINILSPNVAKEKLNESRMTNYKDLLDRKEGTLQSAPSMSGIVWMISSPGDEDDVIGERIEEIKSVSSVAQDVEGVPNATAYFPTNVLVVDNLPRWVAKGAETEETFSYFLGTDTRDPKILNEEDLELNIYPKDRILQVPNTLYNYNTFLNDPKKAIKDIAGRRTVAENAFFNSTSVFEKVFCLENNIFTKDELEISFENPKLDFSNYLYDKTYFSNCRNKECYRYIHLDIASKKDRFGLSSVYSNKQIFKSEEGKEIVQRVYYVDFCLGIVAEKGDSVDLLKALKFVYGLKKLGYPIKLVTTDSHQGELARQIIRRNGVKSEWLSVEKKPEPYLNLKNIIYSELLYGFKNPLLTKELKGLREYKGKVSKGKGYTDDLSDSLAGALYSCSQDRNFRSTVDTIEALTDYQLNKKNTSLLKNKPIIKLVHNRGLGLGF